MNDELRLLDRLALQDLNADFCYHLDHHEVDQLAALFTDDADYRHGERASNGRSEIARHFSERRDAGPRTARHIAGQVRIALLSDVKATGTSVCLTFAQSALPPIGHANPELVADFDDEYVKEPDGRWRISRRIITRIFEGVGNAGPYDPPTTATSRDIAPTIA